MSRERLSGAVDVEKRERERLVVEVRNQTNNNDIVGRINQQSMGNALQNQSNKK